MANSITTNIAAYYAQSNIRTAADKTNSSVARLSSGSRIVKASDDVAALAIGTSLNATVVTLRTAALNAAQGSSLLQIADGGLSKINDIITRQKSIAVQATSGTLSDVERGFLNQEFQALSAEIDRLTTSTKFNQVSLLNGGLSAAQAITTNTLDGTSTAGTTAAAAFTLVAPVAGDKFTVAGVTVEFVAATTIPGSAAAAGKVIIGAAATQTADNVVRFLNESTDARLANLRFTNAAGAVTANWAGGLMSGAFVVDVASVTGTNVTVNTAANRTIAVTNPTDGMGVDRTQFTGSVTGSLLTTGATAATGSGAALSVRAVEDNKNFIGKFGGATIGKITGLYTGVADTGVFSVKVGDITYTTVATDITNAAVQSLTFIGSDSTGAAKGGQFVLNIAGGAIVASSINGQGNLDPIVAQLNDAVSGVTFMQNRDISSFQEGQTVSVGGIQVGSLDGLSANFKSDNFSGVNIESIKVTAPGVGSTDARFEVVINGETFVSTSGIGNQIGINSQIAMQSTTSNRTFTLVTGPTAIAGSSITALDLATQDKADAIQAGLAAGFGLGANGGAKLNFQVGVTSSDTIGVQVNSVDTNNLYGGATLSVATALGAAAASTTLDSAINTLSATRAGVGALQSRFDFAAASIDSSIQNLDAARSALLDTDVAAESTTYATNQVKLQAGISVLAQANQQLQSLLKLIG